MNIGHTLYTTIARYAEGGKRVTKVDLPHELYFEFLADVGTTKLMKTLKVEVAAKDGLKEPKFHLGEEK